MNRFWSFSVIRRFPSRDDRSCHKSARLVRSDGGRALTNVGGHGPSELHDGGGIPSKALSEEVCAVAPHESGGGRW